MDKVAFELVPCWITYSVNQSRWFLSRQAGISHQKHSKHVRVQ